MPGRNALELKGRLLSLTRVRVLDPDPAAFESQLQGGGGAPDALSGLPVVIDSTGPVDLQALLGALRGAGMQPLAIVDGVNTPAARALGLAVIGEDALAGGGRAKSRESKEERPAAEVKQDAANAPAGSAGNASVPAPAAAAPPAVRRGTRIVDAPVRSGQQIYAEGADLVVLSQVSAGAEIIADGCVHVYGRMAGRAIAGARGDTTARLFCKRMEAELVAVAGVYAVAEQMQGELHGKPAQVRLADGKLKVERLDW